MKFPYLNSKRPFYFFFLFLLFLSVSCVTTQGITDSDGIYSNDIEVPKTITTKKGYQQYNGKYFTEELQRLDQLKRNDIITDINNYTSYDSVNKNSRMHIASNEPWGYRSNTNAIVNVTPNFGFYNSFGPFGNSFYYDNGYYNPWNNWGSYYGYYNPYRFGFYGNFDYYRPQYYSPFFGYPYYYNIPYRYYNNRYNKNYRYEKRNYSNNNVRRGNRVTSQGYYNNRRGNTSSRRYSNSTRRRASYTPSTTRRKSNTYNRNSTYRNALPSTTNRNSSTYGRSSGRSTVRGGRRRPN